MLTDCILLSSKCFCGSFLLLFVCNSVGHAKQTRAAAQASHASVPFTLAVLWCCIRLAGQQASYKTKISHRLATLFSFPWCSSIMTQSEGFPDHKIALEWMQKSDILIGAFEQMCEILLTNMSSQAKEYARPLQTLFNISLMLFILHLNGFTSNC